VRDALLIMLNLPFALIRRTLALLRGERHFNISGAVGYIAVFGVSVLNGVVLVSVDPPGRDENSHHGEAILPVPDPLRRSSWRDRGRDRLLPAALSHGMRRESSRPLARS